MLTELTDAEQKIVDQQGWTDNSLISVLLAWNPATTTREEHFRAVAVEENAGHEEDEEDDLYQDVL